MKVRCRTAKPACMIGVLVVLGGLSGCAGAAQEEVAGGRVPASAGAGAAGGSASPVPGTDPAIQRWFLANGPAKVAFNDALLRAERGVARNTASQCKTLSAAVRLLNNALPRLSALSPAGQKLATAIQPALTTFDTAATACLGKNFPAAQTALDAGVVQQADAQAEVDEILDGDL